MTLKVKFFTYIIIIHGVITYLLYEVLRESTPIAFILSEVLVLISIIISIYLYNGFIKPLNLLKTGIDALKDQDYNYKYAETGSYHMDQLIDVFNKMLVRLKNEKVKSSAQSIFLNDLIEQAPYGIILLDYDDRVAQINSYARHFFNFSISTGTAINRIDHEMIDPIYNLEISENKVVSLSGGKKFSCSMDEVLHQGFKRKIITFYELTQEFQETEKKAYSKVIRMMAHEVNNSIGAINSILDTATTMDMDREELAETLQIVMDRNDKMVVFMKNFASVIRLPDPHKQQIDLVPIIENCMSLLFSSHDKNIHISLENKGNNPLIVDADQILVEQVFINILKNSIEAIEAHGQIVVLINHKDKEVIFRDNGSGVSEEAQAKLFSPFFSTKAEGQGIGLMLIRQILNDHGAEFSLETIDGWTAFRIKF